MVVTTGIYRRMVVTAGLHGLPRFAVYLGLQFMILLLPGGALVAPLLLLAILGLADGVFRQRMSSMPGWASWLRRAWPVLLVAAMPAVAGFPWELVGWSARGGPAGLSDGYAGAMLSAWLPGLLRSARFLLVFASAAWLSGGMTAIGLRDVLLVILKPLGPVLGPIIARAAALVMAFLPWTFTEIRRADEAARLRGSDPRRHPGRHLAAMAVPISVRSLEKARISAEALLLRDIAVPVQPPTS
jgi:energy-coupling factor transporter transmembrane protein EcfT